MSTISGDSAQVRADAALPVFPGAAPADHHVVPPIGGVFTGIDCTVPLLSGSARGSDDRHPDPLTNILNRLGGVTQSGNGYKAHCPCPNHGEKQRGDRNKSLSIGVGQNDGVLLNCFAGCEARDVLAAIGLQMRDLYPPGSRRDPSNGRSLRRNTPAASCLANNEHTIKHGDWSFAALTMHDNARANGSLDRLAIDLGVCSRSLKNLLVGEHLDGEFSSWPEMGAKGTVTTINRRYPDGKKVALAGYRRGIYVPGD